MRVIKEKFSEAIGKSVAGRSSNRLLNKFVQFAAMKEWERGHYDYALNLYNAIPSSFQSTTVKQRIEKLEKLVALGASDQINQSETYTAKVQDSIEKVFAQELSLFRKEPLWRRIEILEQFEDKYSDLAPWHAELLLQSWQLRDFNKVIIHSNSLSKIRPLNNEEKFIVSESLLVVEETEDFNDIEKSIKSLINYSTASKDGYKLAFKHNEYMRAIDLLSLKEKNSAISLEILQTKASYLEQGMYWEESCKYYRKALQLDPQNTRLMYKVALNYERLQRYSEAIKFYELAISLDKRTKWFSYRLGTCFLKLELHEEAVSAFLNYYGISSQFIEKIAAESGYYSELYESSFNGISSYSEIIKIKCFNNWNEADKIFEYGKLLPKSDTPARKLVAARLISLSRYDLAALILSKAEVFENKDGLDPKKYTNTTGKYRSTYFAEFQNSLPLFDKLILWESNHGSTAGCNTLAIFTAATKDPKFSENIHVWAINNIHDIPEELTKFSNVAYVKVHSEEYLQVLATAKHVVNNVSFPPYYVRRSGQKYLNTWHGTPFKTLGKSMKQGVLEYENLQRNFIQSTVLLAPNELTRWALVEDHDIEHVYSGVTLTAGSPRLDISLTLNETRKQEIRSLLGASSKNKSLLLYAPTWRGGVSEHSIDLDQLVADLETLATANKDVVVAYRAHRLSEKLIENLDLPVTVVPNSIDTNELLGAIDILATDYSSILFDFIPQKKPIIMHMHDFDQYSNERGLYLDPEQVPGILSYSTNNLKHSVDLALAGNGIPSAEHISKYCPHEDGNSAHRVYNYFFNNIGSSDTILKSYNNSKKKNLLFHCSFLANGITSAFIALLDALDPNLYNVHIIVEPKTLRSNKDRYEQFTKVPPHIKIICRTVDLVRTPQEQSAISNYQRFGELHNQQFTDVYQGSYLREARRILGSFVPDAVIEYDGYSDFWVSLMLAFKTNNNIASCYQHNQMYDEMKKKYPNLKLVFQMYNLFDSIISVSHGLAIKNYLDISNHFPLLSETQKSARNLIKLDAINELSNQDIEDDALISFIESKDFIFSNIARMSVEKNQKGLIEAFANYLSFYPDSGLVLVGSGVLEEELRNQADELGIANSVFFTGQVPNPYSILKKSNCFVLPSFHEGQPITVLEAMSLNIPLIVSDLPGCVEQVKNGYGLITAPAVDSIASSLLEVRAKPSVASGIFSASTYNKEVLKENLTAIFYENR